VLVDGRALTDGNRFRGIGVYLRSLLPELVRIPDLALSALVTDPSVLPGGVAPVRIRRVMPGRYAGAEHDFLLPFEVARFKPDVFHSPALQPPRRCRQPWVQTLHDVIPLTFEAPEFEAQSASWERWAARVRGASKIVAVSNDVATEGARALDLPQSRFVVALHGADPAFRPAPVRGREDPPYILSVAEFDPRKGYREAFDVIAELAARGYPHKLKVAGRVAPWVAEDIQRLVDGVAHHDRIELLGYVPHQSLPALYQRATAAVMTNRAEGFGLPALEAMACGTPLIAFSNSSLTEVIGDGGVLVVDGDVAGVVDALCRVIDDDATWRDLSERGRRRAAGFSWARSAAAHAEVFRAVAAG
jgi:glycosyltransferase involved in cell wall biosynthesis